MFGFMKFETTEQQRIIGPLKHGTPATHRPNGQRPVASRVWSLEGANDAKTMPLLIECQKLCGPSIYEARSNLVPSFTLLS